jgi:hypothetical protein
MIDVFRLTIRSIFENQLLQAVNRKASAVNHFSQDEPRDFH